MKLRIHAFYRRWFGPIQGSHGEPGTAPQSRPHR